MSQASQRKEEYLNLAEYTPYYWSPPFADFSNSSLEDKINIVREKALKQFKMPKGSKPEHLRRWRDRITDIVDAGRTNPSSPEHHFNMIFLVCISVMLGIKREFIGKKAEDITEHQYPNFEYKADISLASAKRVTEFLTKWMAMQLGATTSPSTERV